MTKAEYDLHVAGKNVPWTPSVIHVPGQWKEYYGVLPPAQGTTPTMNEKNDSNEKQVGGRHYKRCAIQPWDYTIANDLDYFQGSIIKYVTRWKDKGGVEDLQKAKHFLDKYIETMEQKFKDMTERPDGKEDPKET